MAGRGRNNTTVCKFFVEGRCKFGANCRFHHPSGGNTGYNRGWQSPGSNRPGFNQSRPNYDGGGGWGQKSQGNRFQLFSDGNDPDGQGFDTKRGGDQNRGGGQRRNPFERLGQRVDSGSQGGWNGDRRSSWNQDRRNDGGWNRSSWGGNQWNSHRDGYDNYGSRRDDRTQQVPSQPTTAKEVAQTIQEDMKEWAASGMWVFSCYAYYKETPCVPGLVDISLEELRFEAYKAKASGSSAGYLQNLEQLGTKQISMQRQLSSISIDGARSLLSIQNSGTDGSGGLFGSSNSPTLFKKSSLFSDSSPSQSSLFGPSSSGPSVTSMFGGQQPQSLFGLIGTPQSAGQSSSAPTTNTATPAQQQSSSQTTTTLTIQQTTSTVNVPSSGAQPTQSPLAGAGKKTLKELINYTQTRELTKQELEAFKANTVVLGKIPEHAPPPQLL